MRIKTLAQKMGKKQAGIILSSENIKNMTMLKIQTNNKRKKNSETNKT